MEIIIFLVIALIVIPPEHLPEVMRAVGKVLRELRLASNTVLREIGSAIDEPPPYMRPLPPPPPPTPAAPASASRADTSATAEAEPAAETAETEPRP